MRLSIVIPTLNEELAIASTLRAAAQVRGCSEIVVVDGGSTDRTKTIAAREGVRIVESERGRGVQLRRGAAETQGDVLWFVHADTLVPANAGEAIQDALKEPSVVGGNFALRFDGASRGARQLTYIYPHLRKLGLCYGDSGIFVRRAAYEAAGGFHPIALFEDLDLLRRLRKQGRFAHLDCELVTSSRRFERRNFAAMFTWWTALQLLYWAGWPPDSLARWYPQVRASAPGTR